MKKVGGGGGLYSNEMAQIKYDKNQEINSLYIPIPKFRKKLIPTIFFFQSPFAQTNLMPAKLFNFDQDFRHWSGVSIFAFEKVSAGWALEIFRIYIRTNQFNACKTTTTTKKPKQQQQQQQQQKQQQQQQNFTKLFARK